MIVTKIVKKQGNHRTGGRVMFIAADNFIDGSKVIVLMSKGRCFQIDKEKNMSEGFRHA